MLRGVEVSKTTLNLVSIEAAILGDGHFLGGAETLASMERDYYYPGLSDRIDPRSWEQKGRQDLAGRARTKAKELLANPDPTYLDAAAEKEIRREFNILLD